MRSYCHKLHVLPFYQHDELCTEIDELAKNLKTTGDAVSYAMFLIDRRTKNNKDAKEKRGPAKKKTSCWTGYSNIVKGKPTFKKKGKRMVPDCKPIGKKK